MQQPRSGLIGGESRKSLSAHSNFPVPWPDSWPASQRSTERQALEALLGVNRERRGESIRAP